MEAAHLPIYREREKSSGGAIWHHASYEEHVTTEAFYHKVGNDSYIDNCVG